MEFTSPIIQRSLYEIGQDHFQEPGYQVGDLCAATARLGSVPTPEVVEAIARQYVSLGSPTIEEASRFLGWAQEAPAEGVELMAITGNPLTQEDFTLAAVYHQTILQAVRDDAQELSQHPDQFTEELQEITTRISFTQQLYRLEQYQAILQAETDPKRQAAVLHDLQACIQGVVRSFNITLHKGSPYGDLEMPYWENLTATYNCLRANVPGYSPVNDEYILRKAVDAVVVGEAHVKYTEAISGVTRMSDEALRERRLQFGAKGANLLALQDVQSQLRQTGLAESIHFDISPFTLLGVETFNDWMAGRDITEKLAEAYEWMHQIEEADKYHIPLGWMIRSSAVHSEDGQNITGAGIYYSEHFNSPAGEGSFGNFCAAVVRVYESTNSPQARQYRQEHGIADEKMGIVLQQYVRSLDDNMIGYTNSAMPGLPNMVEVVSRHSRNLAKKDALLPLLGMRGSDLRQRIFGKNLLHFPVDGYKVWEGAVEEMAVLTTALEVIWGRPIQIEYVCNTIYPSLFQIRPLPSMELTAANEINFPDEPHMHEGAAIGMLDEVLPVLDNYADNSDSVGVVVIPSNYGWSMRGYEAILPKAGVVVILYGDGPNGHIQTLCAEKGLTCIFEDGRRSSKGRIAVMNDPNLFGHDYIRVVSNGIEGRIYSAEG